MRLHKVVAASTPIALVWLLVAPAGPGSAAGAPHDVVVAHSAAPAFTPSASCANGSPAYNFPGSGDAADPQVVSAGGEYYAFTTGNALGNNLAALVSSSPSGGFAPYTGTCFGSSALPSPSAWEAANTQTSPGVFEYGGHWVMFYDAAQSGHASDSGFDCLAVAMTASISPTHVAFTDASASPLLCQPTGSIDPQPFVDPATGTAYLLWKQNDGGSATAATIWSQPLNPSGTAFAAGSQASRLLVNDTVDYPWENTVENPAMVNTGGTYYLAFSAGIYTSNNYSEGIATCNGPSGPCGVQTQILTTYNSVLGPGGGAPFADASGNWWFAFAAWQGGSTGCTNYTCGAARRLFTASVTLPASTGKITCPTILGPHGYRMVASDGGIFDFGTLPFCGSEGGRRLNKPIVGMAPTPSGAGYWEVASDGGIFAFGDAQFFGSTGMLTLNQPIVGMAATPDGLGYWLVAADGGIFAFGRAQFFGSTGALRLNRPIVGMTASSDGRGYYLVASDGGIFTFGDAVFSGSTGALRLNQPIVGMALDGGAGYWLVAADGGIFAFGTAAFEGSTGGTHLNQPIVGMARVPAGHGVGYWLVAADGGIFTFGSAAFDGSTGGTQLNQPIVGMSGV